jgi:hypothetical protein
LSILVLMVAEGYEEDASRGGARPCARPSGFPPRVGPPVVDVILFGKPPAEALERPHRTGYVVRREGEVLACS